MNEHCIETFESSLEDLEVEWTRTPAPEVEETIADRLAGRAIGVPIPIEGVRLPDAVTLDPTPADLEAATTGVTGAALGIADYGSVVLESTAAGSEPVSLFPDEHIVVVRTEDIVPDMETAFERITDRLRSARSSAILATGPSATADMGALVRGAHGPKDVHVVLADAYEDEP